MYKDVFIADFSMLGSRLMSYCQAYSNNCINESDDYLQFISTLESSQSNNPNFLFCNQIHSLSTICSCFLDKKRLEDWLYDYDVELFERDREVCVVCAGNIPLVGFHDILSVLSVGYKVAVKPSSKDKFWYSYIKRTLCSLNPFWEDRINIVSEISDVVDALIVSGSDSTIDYFSKKYYNSKLLLRGSMTSVAILKGDESRDDLDRLALDICLYSGMGCRSVTNLFVPESYDFSHLIESTALSFKYLSKGFYSSYLQNKAVLTLSDTSFIDANNFVLIQDFGAKISTPPAGIVYYRTYSSNEEILGFLDNNITSIQVVVNYRYNDLFVNFGDSQKPKLIDYADNVNTLDFLLKSL